MAPWLQAMIIKAIVRKIKERIVFKKLLKEGGIAALIVGLVSSVSGVDIAVDDVDKVMTGLAVVAIYGPQIWDGVKAHFSKE